MLAHGRLRRKHGLPPGFQGLSATSQAVASGEWTRSDGESRGTGLVVWDATSSAATRVIASGSQWVNAANFGVLGSLPHPDLS